MDFEYDNSIITQRRTGDSTNPFVDKNEAHIVNIDGKVILSEIPNRFTRVVVEGDNVNWFEIREGNLSVDSFRVAYDHTRLVTFHDSHIGKQLNFIYKGEGLVYAPADMIYTNQNNGDITETLKQLTDSTGQARETTKVATSNANDAAIYANSRGDYAQTEADSFLVDITTQNTVTASANTFTLDLSLKKNFTITIADVNPKIITLTNIPPDLDFALPVTVKVVCTVGNIISTYPTGTIWVDGVVPVFAIGKTYYLTFIRTTAGWHAIYLGAF